MASTDESQPELLEVGRITKPHGLKGDVLVKFVTDRTNERAAAGAELTLSDGRVLTIVKASPHKDRWIVEFVGVKGREAAEALHSQLLFAEPIDDPDALFIHQIVGRRLKTVDGADHGEIANVLDNPASDLMELTDGRLVPMAFYVSHDNEAIVVDVPDGLLNDPDD